MMSTPDVRRTGTYVAVTIATFVVLQTVLIVMHEFTHSTAAWLLGYMPRPFSIVWGNPLTMKGWDEGVPYHRLFPSGGNPAEAIIGGSPLADHTIVVAVGLLFLQRQWMVKHKWVFHIVYWFVAANLMELVAYIVMRPFTPGGDTGHFNRGLGLSPWILFVAGTLLLLFALYVFFGRILPVLNDIVAGGNRTSEWAILLMTAFIVFLWGSGIRMMSMYPDPQWKWGLIGVVAFAAVLFIFRPDSAARQREVASLPFSS